MTDKTLFLAWQAKDRSRQWFPVGRLDVDEAHSKYRFGYIQGALQAHDEAGFQPLIDFPDMGRSYVSPELFPLFKNRVMTTHGTARSELQPSRRPRVLRQRPAARVHRAEGGLQEHPRGVRRQPARLPRRERHRARLPPQRVRRREQRPSRAVRQHHERLGALRPMEAQRRGRKGPPRRRDAARRDARQGAGALGIIERAHPDLGRLGVFWHTQGSGKSYSMAFFAQKVRRRVSNKFTFVVMTDRTDLDTQIYGTFVGCGLAGKETPRATTGKDLKRLLGENHGFVFSLIHKFGKDVDPKKPYSERDDIIVLSDEAHRTQAGKLARNMRLALPNASFLGFTGTPLFKHDELTRRIFGSYISRYDFKRSEEDGATVKLIYENRGEKLGVARLDLNDRIAEAVERADLDSDERALLEKLLGRDYEVITADDRLDKIATDFVEHCAMRWEAGKAMLVEVFIRNELMRVLPSPPFTPADQEDVARRVFRHVRQQSVSGRFPTAAQAA